MPPPPPPRPKLPPMPKSIPMPFSWQSNPAPAASGSGSGPATPAKDVEDKEIDDLQPESFALGDDSAAEANHTELTNEEEDALSPDTQLDVDDANEAEIPESPSPAKSQQEAPKPQPSPSPSQDPCQGKGCELVKIHDRVIKEHHEALAKLKSDAKTIAHLQGKTAALEAHVDALQAEAKALTLKVGQSTVKTVVELKLPDNPETIPCDNEHRQFPDLLRCVMADVPTWLVGPAGSFKSTAAKRVADFLGLPFYCTSVCAQTSVATFTGYMDAHGNYVRSLFRQAYELGGLFLLDEVDNGNPNVLASLNAALSIPFYPFPDGVIERHPKFRIIAAGNTYGNGASREYVGRNPIDAATLDRFAFLFWEYDEELEVKLVPGNPFWAKFVQACRKQVARLQIRAIISPRASILGAKLLAAGIPPKQVKQMVTYKGLTPDQIKKIEEGLANDTKADWKKLVG